jgi:hypothetical protein
VATRRLTTGTYGCHRKTHIWSWSPATIRGLVLFFFHLYMDQLFRRPAILRQIRRRPSICPSPSISMAVVSNFTWTVARILHLGPVVQSWISDNPRLKFNLLF